MPRVDRYRRERSIPGVGGAVRGSPEIASAAGAALGQVAAGAADLAGAVERLEARDGAVAAARIASETRLDWSRRLLDAQQTAAEDPVGFADAQMAAFDSDLAARLKAAPRAARPALEVRLAQLRATVGTGAAQFEAQARADKRRRDLDATLTAGINAVRTDAGAFAGAVGDALGAIEASSLTAPSKREAERAVRDGLGRALIARLNETDPARARRLLEDGTLDDYLAAKSKNALVDDNAAELRRRAAAEESARRAARTELRAAVGDAVKMMEAGFDPGAERILALGDRARALEDTDAAAELATARGLLAFADDARRQTPTALQDWLHAARSKAANADPAKGVAPAAAARIALGEKILGRMSDALSKDPLSWAQRVGAAEITPLRLFAPGGDPLVEGDGDQAVASMRQRRAAAHQVAARYGTAPRMLTDEEAMQLEAAMGSASLDAQLMAIAQIGRGFGEDAPAVFAELREKRPVLAHVAGLAAAGSPPAALRDALAGHKALEDGAEAVLPPRLDRDGWTEEVLGAAFAAVPGTRRAVLDTTRAIYHARASRAGIAEPDEGLWHRALQASAGAAYGGDGSRFGGIGDWRGQKLVLPPGMSEAAFETALRRVTDADLAAAGARHANGAAFTAKELREDGFLISVGAGQYLVSLTDPAAGPRELIQGRGPGGAWLLDLEALAPSLAGRAAPIEDLGESRYPPEIRGLSGAPAGRGR